MNDNTAKQMKLELDRNSGSAMTMDYWLFGALAILLAVGMVMVFSSSIAQAENNFGDPYAYLKRQIMAMGLGLMVAYITFYIPMHFWKKNRGYLLLLGYFLLIAVLIVGTEINGSKRWLPLPFFNFQPSELMKLIAIVFMAGFLIKHHNEVSARVTAVLRLAIPFALMGVLLLLEPDFGATFVIISVLAIMLFIAGAPIKHFLIILLPSSALAVILINNAQYRLARVQSFIDPWDDPFGTDYQLIQSLLAHGQGGWSGVGLGESVQKLAYLPEAHTDYIFSIFGEELGVIGVLALIALYLFIIYRIFLIGAHAMQQGHSFDGLVAYGVGAWIAVQAMINMSVTLGLAPSKGLTLPLFSYGGSSMLIFLSALAMVFRVDYEARHLPAVETKKQSAAKQEGEPEQKASAADSKRVNRSSSTLEDKDDAKVGFFAKRARLKKDSLPTVPPQKRRASKRTVKPSSINDPKPPRRQRSKRDFR